MRCDGEGAADVWETVRASEGLATFECHFKYSARRTEEPLVKVRACESCAKKLGVSDGFARVDEAAEEERRARRERKKSKKRRARSSGRKPKRYCGGTTGARRRLKRIAVERCKHV